MKLVSSFLSLLPLAYPATFHVGNDVQQVPDDHSATSFEDLVPLWMDRANADGGSCPGPNFQEIYETYKHKMFDFRGGIRYRFNAEPSEPVKIELNEVRDGHIWWGSGQFDTIHVEDYSGKVWFTNQSPPTRKTNYAYPFMYPNNGGWFCVKETRNRNDLRFAYGNKFHQKQSSHDGFVPHYGLVLTWIYTSNDEAGCPSDEGNIFQMLVLIGRKDRKKRQTRIVYNYPLLNYPATVDETHQPMVGFKDKKPDPINIGDFIETAWWNPDMNDDTDDITTLVGKSYVYKDFDTQLDSSPLTGDNWFATPDSCETQRSCHCDDLLAVDQIVFEAPDGTVLENSEADIAEKLVHWDFSGHCSRTEDTLNYGDYAIDNRGYFCYVKSLSDACTDGGKFVWPFTPSNYPDANPNQMVQLTKFECVITRSDLGKHPFWRRWRTTAEKKLNRAIKAAAAAGRRASKKNRRNNRKLRPSKWQRKQNKAQNRNGPTVRAHGPVFNVQCDFGCEHPDVWATSSFSIPNSNGPMWQDLDFTAGGGVWECFDSDGNPDSGTELEKDGMCKLKCEDGPNAGNSFEGAYLVCSNWNKLYGAHQYGIQELREYYLALSASGFSCA